MRPEASDPTGPVASDPVPGAGLPDSERSRRHVELVELLDVMRPAVEADGGQLHLLGADVEHGVVQVALSGACGSCSVSSMTLEGGIERILRQRLPWFRTLEGQVWGADPEW